MKCPKCNSEVKKGAFFCTQCGIRLFDDKGKYLFEKTTEADKNIDVDSMNALNDGNKNTQLYTLLYQQFCIIKVLLNV